MLLLKLLLQAALLFFDCTYDLTGKRKRKRNFQFQNKNRNVESLYYQYCFIKKQISFRLRSPYC